MLFFEVRPCIFQTGTFTGCGNEGGKGPVNHEGHTRAKTEPEFALTGNFQYLTG